MKTGFGCLKKPPVPWLLARPFDAEKCLEGGSYVWVLGDKRRFLVQETIEEIADLVDARRGS